MRGYQKRATPEEVEAHNAVVMQIREEMEFGTDADSAEDEEEIDDFDFYRLQQQDDQAAAPAGRMVRQPSGEDNLAEESVSSGEEKSGDDSEDGITSSDEHVSF